MRKRINRLRIELLDLQPLSFFGPYHSYSKSSNYLCSYSNFLSPKPADWGEKITVGGYWFMKQAGIFKLDDSLLSFIKSGDKPILLDLGSFSHQRLQPKLTMIIEDILSLKKRLLIYPGKMDTTNYETNDKIYFLDSNIPHEVLLPEVELVITTGGVGAVHAALKAGIPIIPISLFGAQYFWGKKLFELELGSRPLRIRQLKQNDVQNAFNYIYRNPKIFEKSRQMSVNIINEPGSKKAVETIRNRI